MRKKEVGQLCSIYAATMLKMMKEAYIPDFEGWKKEIMESKTAVWNKEFNARWESFLKERDERSERARKELSIPFKQRMRMRQQTTEEEKKKDREFAEQDDAYMLEARKEWDKKGTCPTFWGPWEEGTPESDHSSKIREDLYCAFCWTTTPAKPPKCLNT